MKLSKNVIIDSILSDKIKSDDLSMLDDLKLFLANFASSLFADKKVYTNANQQNTAPPCLFIDFYAINKKRRLYDTATYEIGFTISYIAKNHLSSTELDNALFLLQQGITDIKQYSVQSVDGDVTDGIANVTGVIKLSEINPSSEEFINKTEQELNLK